MQERQRLVVGNASVQSLFEIFIHGWDFVEEIGDSSILVDETGVLGILVLLVENRIN